MNAFFFLLVASTPASPAECLARFPERAPSSARAYFNHFDSLFREVGEARNIDPALLKAVAYCETRLDPCAISEGAHAAGLMQFMPATFREVGPIAHADDPFEPRDSIRAAGLYLAALTNYWRGDFEAVVASYNAGPNAVARARRKGLRIPDIAETTGYVACVTQTHAWLRRSRPAVVEEPASLMTSFSQWLNR